MTREDIGTFLSGLTFVAFLLFVGAFMYWWWSPLFGSGEVEAAQEVELTADDGVGATAAAVPVGAGAPAVASAEPTAAPTQAPTAEPVQAPHCAPGQEPAFVLGFAELKAQLGSVMGKPIECEHTNPDNGDALQHTTTGLAVYSPSEGQLRFTDGWRQWALTPAGLVSWEGDEEPAALRGGAQTTGEAGGDVSAGTAMEVVNTDGLGVVLRSAPEEQARLPRGFLEGAQVKLLGRSGEYLRVRGPNGQEGWVPMQYLAPVDGTTTASTASN